MEVMTKGLCTPPRSDKVTGKRLRMCEDKGGDGKEVQEKHSRVTKEGCVWKGSCVQTERRLHATDSFEIKTPATQGVRSLGYVNALGHGGLHNSCSVK